MDIDDDDDDEFELRPVTAKSMNIQSLYLIQSGDEDYLTNETRNQKEAYHRDTIPYSFR